MPRSADQVDSPGDSVQGWSRTSTTGSMITVLARDLARRDYRGGDVPKAAAIDRGAGVGKSSPENQELTNAGRTEATQGIRADQHDDAREAEHQPGDPVGGDLFVAG